MTESLFTLAAFADEASPDLEAQIAALKRNGLTCLELRNVNGKSCADLTVPEAKELKKRLDGAGICVRTVGSPIGKIPVTGDFGKEKERFLRLCQTAEVLGADRMRIFSFYRDTTLSEEKGREIALTYLREFAEQAGNITLCHENEKGIYGDGFEFCRIICTQIPAVRAIFDPANFVQCGVDTQKAWEALNPFVSYLHLKDANAQGVVVPCGQGIGNVPEILWDYRKNGGDFATVEPHLFDFSAKKNLEKDPAKTCGSAYETADAAFDAAIGAVKTLLKGSVNVS